MIWSFGIIANYPFKGKKMKLISFVASVLLASFSIEAKAGSGWTEWKKIKSVQVNDAGNIEIVLDGAPGTACTSGDGGTWSYIKSSDVNKQQKYALALSAASSGKLVKVYCSADASPHAVTIWVAFN